MAERQIQFGQGVYSQDGEKLGSIEDLVLNTENNHVENLVVKQGFLSGDKLIDIDLIDRVEGDRIILTVPAEEAEQLPGFVEDQFVAAPADVTVDRPFVVPGGFRLYYDLPTAGRGYPGRSTSLFDPAPIDPPPVESTRNIPPQDVMISQGTDVVGADGEKVGTVDEVIFDEHGQTAGFVIKEGLIFKHQLRVPMDWVKNAGEDEIRLNVPSNVVGKEGMLRGV